MNKTTKTTQKVLENMIATVYGANALNCDAIVVEWAAGKLAEAHGAEFAAKEWKRVNRRREKLGRYTSIPQWGTEMFAAF